MGPFYSYNADLDVLLKLRRRIFAWLIWGLCLLSCVVMSGVVFVTGLGYVQQLMSSPERVFNLEVSVFNRKEWLQTNPAHFDQSGNDQNWDGALVGSCLASNIVGRHLPGPLAMTLVSVFGGLLGYQLDQKL